MSEDRVKLREYHAPVWDEPVIMELGHPGRRGQVFFRKAGKVSGLIPKGLARTEPPALPEMTEPEVQRHYLHLCQQTLGMVNISLFGTCTMKYNARASEAVMQLPQVADVHPLQPDDSIQGILQAIHEFDLGLRALSGMDQFIFQAGGGADAAYTNCVVTRAYHQSRGELVRRNEIITSIQAHPCNAATAAAAGFKVVTLNLEKNGYPSVDALKAAISDRTAALFINNPNDMGIYNPDIKEWVRLVQEAGGLCF
ncbi:MAG TPA: aminotransferase class V-fold PLP-dependent enzyme, partial [Pseudolabrys sp.]|nr:aminotransferase class V-fold PLP-dependent enzyme [Pseudolabrys sp.]